MAGREVYRFGEFTLDTSERRFSRSGQDISLAPKAFDLLLTLVRQRGRLVTKLELLETVLPESFVEEGILAVHISALRKTLGNGDGEQRYIETVSRAGYRFTGAVTRRNDPAEAARNPEVYELFGRGRMFLLSHSMFDVPKAIEAFEAAVELDPGYGAAHAGLALAYCAQASMRAVPPSEAYGKAKTAALRALAMDPGCADAQAALGAVLFFSEWNWAAAERSLQRALASRAARQPNSFPAMQLAVFYGEAGNRDAAFRHLERAIEDHDPSLVHLAVGPQWDSLRDDARFGQCLERMGLRGLLPERPVGR